MHDTKTYADYYAVGAGGLLVVVVIFVIILAILLLNKDYWKNNIWKEYMDEDEEDYDDYDD